MSKQIILKLRADAKPHLYIDKIKEYIARDGVLRPEMKNLLLFMKQKRTPFVRLALQREVIIVPEFFCNLDRALDSELTPYFKTDWSEDEKKEYVKDAIKFEAKALSFFGELGYAVYQEKVLDIETTKKLVALTTVKKEAKK